MLGKKRGRGRKKIEIKKIEEKSNRQVTFAKRRHGLFNKASELSILTGAHVAILIKPNSNRNRVLSFSHPPNDAILHRFLTGVHDPSRDDETLIRDFGENYSDMCVEVDKARNAAAVGTPWWEKAEEEMGLEELEQFRVALQELLMSVDLKATELEGKNKCFNTEAASSSSAVPEFLNQIAVDKIAIIWVIPLGGPIYVPDLVGPLARVPDFETYVCQELQSLKEELCEDSLEMCDEDISILSWL